MPDHDTIPAPKKPLSGAQRRKVRISQGLPKFGEAEKAGRKAWSSQFMKKRYAERRALIDGIKLARGCADCNYNQHPAALEFDHLPGTAKTDTIAHMFYWSPLQDVMAEIAKCEVVCANCHAIRTVTRRQK